MSDSKTRARDVEYYLALDYPIQLSLWTEPDEEYWVAEVSDLAGCLADGGTPDEAVENLVEAKKLWGTARLEEGFEVPEPSDTRSYSGRILVRLPKSLHKRLAAAGRREGMSLNAHEVRLLAGAGAPTVDLSSLQEQIADLRDQILGDQEAEQAVTSPVRASR